MKTDAKKAVDAERRFFEIQTVWPDDYCSFTISPSPVHKGIRNTNVYKEPCNEDYLREYAMTNFMPGFVPDVLPNNHGWLIVSPQCRKAIERASLETTAHFVSVSACLKWPKEFANYFLISNAEVFDCVDLTSPELKWFDSSKKLVQQYRRLVLISKQIPPGASFFGVSRVPVVHVVSSAVREGLVNRNITGLDFKECEIVSS
jgi:hypothetical protein